MRSKLYTAAALITMVTFVSCAGSDSNDYIDKSLIPTAAEKAAAEKAAPAPATVTPGANPLPANTVAVPGASPVVLNPQNNTVMTPVQTAVQPTAPGMNPPHGQPNHRCDIAVGAPLNSKPAPAAAQPAQVSAQPNVTMTEIPNKVKTAPGMNPPHGEPGHRCDIAVGAPLNSKPAPANAQPITVGTPPAQPAVTMTEVANTQKTAPGMNPPHGQPNHRCDIAVGAPLNSPVQPKAPAGMLAPAKADSGKN